VERLWTTENRQKSEALGMQQAFSKYHERARVIDQGNTWKQKVCRTVFTVGNDNFRLFEVLVIQFIN
jgi:hypothetical protein